MVQDGATQASKCVNKDAFQPRCPSGFKIRTMFTPSMWSSIQSKSPPPSCPQLPPTKVVLGEGAQGPELSWHSRDTGHGTCPGHRAGGTGTQRWCLELSAHPWGMAQMVVSAGILRGSTGGHPIQPAWALNPLMSWCKMQGRNRHGGGGHVRMEAQVGRCSLEPGTPGGPEARGGRKDPRAIAGSMATDTLTLDCEDFCCLSHQPWSSAPRP